MLGETWKDHHERLKRSHALFQQVGGRTLLPQDRDNAYHFCCDALHLRDGIAAAVAEPSFTTHMLPKEKQNIIQGINDQITAELFTPSRELSACEDIANGSKHLILTRRSRMTSQRAGYAEIVQSAEVNVGTRSVEERFEIEIDGQNHDLRKVADRAVEAWDNWLTGSTATAQRLRNLSK